VGEFIKHPYKAASTAAMAQLMNTPPSCCGQSIAGQALTVALPSRTFIPVTSSSIRTRPSPLQSPTQRSGVAVRVSARNGAVAVGVWGTQVQSSWQLASLQRNDEPCSHIGGGSECGVHVGVGVVANTARAVARTSPTTTTARMAG
jgi:hypothetical protein